MRVEVLVSDSYVGQHIHTKEPVGVLTTSVFPYIHLKTCCAPFQILLIPTYWATIWNLPIISHRWPSLMIEDDSLSNKLLTTKHCTTNNLLMIIILPCSMIFFHSTWSFIAVLRVSRRFPVISSPNRVFNQLQSFVKPSGLHVWTNQNFQHKWVVWIVSWSFFKIVAVLYFPLSEARLKPIEHRYQ